MKNTLLQKRRRKTEFEKLYELVSKTFRKTTERWQRKYMYSSPEEYQMKITHYVNEYKYAKENETDFNLAEAIQSEASTLTKHTGEGTRRWLFGLLKNEARPEYNHLNTYLYRLGYSVADYFNNPDNSKIDVNGSIVTMTLELPFKAKGITYDQFIVEYHISSPFGAVLNAKFI